MWQTKYGNLFDIAVKCWHNSFNIAIETGGTIYEFIRYNH